VAPPDAPDAACLHTEKAAFARCSAISHRVLMSTRRRVGSGAWHGAQTENTFGGAHIQELDPGTCKGIEQTLRRRSGFACARGGRPGGRMAGQQVDKCGTRGGWRMKSLHSKPRAKRWEHCAAPSPSWFAGYQFLLGPLQRAQPKHVQIFLVFGLSNHHSGSRSVENDGAVGHRTRPRTTPPRRITTVASRSNDPRRI